MLIAKGLFKLANMIRLTGDVAKERITSFSEIVFHAGIQWMVVRSDLFAELAYIGEHLNRWAMGKACEMA